jgi:sugar transferase (PEP-CTERM system associated)
LKLRSATLGRLPSPALVLIFVDTLALFAAFYLAVWVRFGLDLEWAQESMGPIMPRALSFATWVLVGLLSMGLYRARQRPTAEEAIVRVMLGVALGGAGSVVFFYLIPSLTLGRGVLLVGLAIASLLLVGGRLGILRLLDANPNKRRVLVIGVGDTSEKLRLRRRADRRGFDIVGFVATSDLERLRAAETGAVGVISLEEARSLRQLDEIVVALDDRRGFLPLEFLLQQKKVGVPVSDVVDFLERETERLDLDILRPSWLLYEKSSQTDTLYRWFKRSFDITSSAALLIVCLPVFLAVIVAIWFEEGLTAPIFYRQKRVGRNGRIIRLLKFRSMKVDAERHSGPRFASTNDERVTRVGRFIRRFRIDELPQLVNVLQGVMSVVGPRPERPEFVEELSHRAPLYFYRHGVRPGLTGWAQLNYPYGASIDDGREKLAYDLYYIKNASITMDLLILLQTLEIVVWGHGTTMSGGARPWSPETPGADSEPPDQAVGRPASMKLASSQPAPKPGQDGR